MKIPYAVGSKGAWEKTDYNVFRYFYEILPQLYDIKTIVIIGPGKHEEKYFNNFEKVIVFEPDEKRAEELEKLGIEVINDFGYKCSKYLKENYIDAIYAFNVCNWVPFNFVDFLECAYKSLKDDGILIISLYQKVDRRAKDRKYINITPRSFIKILNKYSSNTISYKDGNGILIAYTIEKKNLNYIMSKIFEEYKKALETLIFLEGRKIKYERVLRYR